MKRSSVDHTRRRWLAAAAASPLSLLSAGPLSFAGAGTAAAQGAAETGVTKTGIKIGMSAGLTGPIAFASRQFSSYMQHYFEKVNAAGGVNGRKLELVVVDDGGKGDTALRNAQRLLQQDQVFAMTTVGSATTAGVLQYLTEQNVPLLFPGAYNTELISPARPNTFALYQPYEGQIAALTRWGYGEKGAGSAVIVRANPPAFDLAAKSAAAEVEAAKGKVLATLNTAYNQPEWSSIVIRVKEMAPDYLIVMSTAPDLGRFWKEITQQKAFPKKAVLGISPLADQAFLDTAGSVPDDMIYAAVPATVVQTSPAAQSARDLVPGETMGIFGLDGVASGAVMVEAIRQLGNDVTRSKLVDLLANRFGPFKTPYMDTAKSAPNHLLVPSVGVATVKKGAFVAATDKFVL